ncbi:MAG TPA: anthranilate phosphoribosyltransferase [Opitutaceae bacterium]|nr:anthranilate phosphoribosyltransferase [Opitutaceae bacterium]
MSALAALTSRIEAQHNLTPAEVAEAAAALASEPVPDEAKAAFLGALARKGETAGELAAFAAYFRTQALDPAVGPWAGRAIDVVGTGGDHAGGFNISSLVTLVLAAGGVVVMKHGNRGITSKCGSADLLAALGVDLEAPPAKLRRALDELGYCFFFAPAHHPAFRRIAPVRKALAAQGQRTVFNVLGPLINPGRPARTLLGVSAAPLVEKLAHALDALGTESALVVHGALGPDRGIDELTTATENRVRGAGRLRDFSATWRAGDFGLAHSPFAELQGGDVAANIAITEAILAGRGPTGLVDTIVLNAAVGLWLSGVVRTVREGLAPARDLLLGGAVARKIAATREFYQS